MNEIYDDDGIIVVFMMMMIVMMMIMMSLSLLPCVELTERRRHEAQYQSRSFPTL